MPNYIQCIPLIMLACSLNACSHYQYLKNSSGAASETNLNRYSHNNIAILTTKKTEFKNQTTGINNELKPSLEKNITLNQIAKKIKIDPSSSQLVGHSFKKKVAEADQSAWNQFINIFTAEKVKPWQKATLAKATMKPGGLNPDSEKFNQKIYSSKESSRGGLGVAGGGCGCN